MVCTFAASSPDSGRMCHAAGHQYRRQAPRRRQRHHHRRQPLVARRYADHAFPRRQRAHQAAQHDRRIVADTAASPSCRRCPACGRRRDRCRRRRKAWRAEISARARPRPPAGQLPSARCGSRARWPRRSPRAGRRACSGSEIRDRGGARAPSPCPAFCVRPKRLPDGSVSSISAVSGSIPPGRERAWPRRRDRSRSDSSTEPSGMSTMGKPFPRPV